MIECGVLVEREDIVGIFMVVGAAVEVCIEEAGGQCCRLPLGAVMGVGGEGFDDFNDTVLDAFVCLPAVNLYSSAAVVPAGGTISFSAGVDLAVAVPATGLGVEDISSSALGTGSESDRRTSTSVSVFLLLASTVVASLATLSSSFKFIPCAAD